MGTKLKSRQSHLAGTLSRGGTLPRVTDNVMCHTKDSTHGNFFFKKEIQKELKN